MFSRHYNKLFERLKKENISLLRFMFRAKLTPIELFRLRTNCDIRLSTLSKTKKLLNCDVTDLFDEEIIYE